MRVHDSTQILVNKEGRNFQEGQPPKQQHLKSGSDLRSPQKRQKKKRYNGNGLNACDRRPPEYVNHIWSYDIMEDRLQDGRKIRILNVIDEFTRESSPNMDYMSR